MKTQQAVLAALREEIRKGIDSGAGVLASEVLERLEAKYREPQSREKPKS